MRGVSIAAALAAGWLMAAAAPLAGQGSAAPAAPVHYHANFAVWVDGAPLDLSAERFMEDVQLCRVDEGPPESHPLKASGVAGA